MLSPPQCQQQTQPGYSRPLPTVPGWESQAAAQVSLNMDLQEVFQPVLKLEYLQIHSLSIQLLDSADTAAGCDNTFGLQHLLPYDDQACSANHSKVHPKASVPRAKCLLCLRAEFSGLENSIKLLGLSNTHSDSQLSPSSVAADVIRFSQVV